MFQTMALLEFQQAGLNVFCLKDLLKFQQGF